MRQRSVPTPGIITRIDIDSSIPDPDDCMPPGESPIATASLAPGWIAVTDRAIFSYHPDRDRAVIEVPKQNVTGIALRRSGGKTFIRYAPAAIVYTLTALVFGALLLTISPAELIAVPDAPGVGGLETIVLTLAWASRLLGTVLLFTGILTGLGVIVVVGYWMVSNEVTLVLERGDTEPIACPTDRHTGTRAVGTIRNALST